MSEQSWLWRVMYRHPVGTMRCTLVVLLGLGLGTLILAVFAHLRMWVRPWWHTNLGFSFTLVSQVLYLINLHWIVAQLSDCLALQRRLHELEEDD